MNIFHASNEMFITETSAASALGNLIYFNISEIKLSCHLLAAETIYGFPSIKIMNCHRSVGPTEKALVF